MRKRKIQKKKPFGRILRTIIRDGRELQFHATKGWRVYRSSGARP